MDSELAGYAGLAGTVALIILAVIVASLSPLIRVKLAVGVVLLLAAISAALRIVQLAGAGG